MKAKFINESELFKGKSEEDLYNSLKDINPLYAKIVAYISTHYTNWSPQVSTTVENHFFRFDPREWPVSFNYMKYRIHYQHHDGNVVLGISNDNNRYDYYIVKDFGDFITLMRNKGGRPAIEPARKNVRIRESKEDLFKPKSDEEIEKNLDEHPDYKIEGVWSKPTEHLRNALYQHNLAYAKYAIKHGGKPLDSFNKKTGGSSGNLWVAFHEAHQYPELIIEMLKTKQIQKYWSQNKHFRIRLLAKAIYMGMKSVVEWVLVNFDPPYSEVFAAVNHVEIEWGTSTWSGYQDVLDYLIPWLKERKTIKESVGDILKPKPANEIDRELKNYSPVFYEIYQEVYNNPAYTNVNINPRRTLGGATGFTLDFEIQDYHFEVIVVNKDKEGERGWQVYIPKQIVIRHTPPSKIFFLDSVQILNLREFNYYINRALEEKNSMKESISNILKPKSREEIQKALEYTEEDEYTDMVDKEIDRQRVMFGDDTIFSKYRELVNAGFKEKTPPSEVASQIIQTFYQNDWKPDGAMALTNTGGIELKVVESGDGVEYRFTGEIVPHGAEIEYDYRDDDGEETDWSEVGSTDEDERESKAFFKDENENKWYLEDFMRIDYPYFG